MTTRVMRDSTTLTDIPTRGLDLIAVYATGTYYSTPPQVRAHAPGVPIVWIDVFGNDPGADVLDVETGDATVPQAVAWTRARRALQPAYPPVIYCNRATLTPLFNAMNTAGMQIGKHFRLWVATLDGTTRLADMTGVTAVQHKGQNLTGGHYDESVVYDAAWKAPAPAPPPPVPPVPVKVSGVVVTLPSGATHPVTSTDGTTWSTT